MLHRKILDPVLERLDGESATYFHNMVAKLEADPRTERAPNLIYLTLKETVPYLPIYLDAELVINQLLVFVSKNRGELNKVLYSRDYVNDPSCIKAVTNGFVAQVLSSTLEKYDEGEIETGEQKVYRVAWPYDAVEFPFADPDADDT